MFTEGALHIELHRGSKITVLEIQAEQALIGSGAHCDVRLAPDEAAIEQLSLETLDEEVHARVLSVDRPCLLNGAPFLEGRIPPTAMLELGSVVVCAKFIPRQASETKKGRQSSTHPAVQGVALLALAGGFYYVLTRPTGLPSAIAQKVVAPPTLSIASEPCPQRDPLAAASLAGETLLAAEGKRERAPFYPSDGLSAVQLFGRAASCYERAGDAPAMQAAREAAGQLEQRLSDELHVRHVRLERLLAEQKYAEVKREGQLIAEFIADPAHEYSQWLSAVVREGDLQARKVEKKR